MSRRTLLTLVILLPAVTVHANEIPCAPVEAGTIHLDGLLNDWQGAEGVGVDQPDQIIKGRKDWTGPADLSFDLYCNFDDSALYLAINVKDEYFIRTKKAKGDDHVMVLIGGRQLVIFPGDLRTVAGRVTWGKRGKAKGIQMAEALQTQGYSLELSIPWKAVPGYKAGQPSIPGAVWVMDSDSKAKEHVETIIGTAASAKQGSFVFAQAKADLSAFLKDKGYKAADVRSKTSADVVGDGRLEQVLLVGRSLGIIGEGLPGGAYFYLDLPVKQPKDIAWLKLLDLNGDGKAELVARYTERNKTGRRDLLAVFRFNDSQKFVRSFAHELLKGQGTNVVTNSFSTRPRKKGRSKRGGVDLIFDKPLAKGFSRESYREAPAQDCFPILLPWDGPKKRSFRFEGEEYSEL